MRMRSHRTVVWTSSVGWTDSSITRRLARPSRIRRVRYWLRVGALLTILGLMRVAKTARTRWPRVLLLAGAAVIVAGISLPSSAVLIPGILILLAGVLSPSSGDTETNAARRADAALVYRR